MDINLLPGAGADHGPRNFSPVLQVIRRIVSPDNGPYALVTWTDTPAAHAALINFLEQNLPNECKPCAEFCLSKAKYLEDAPALRDRISTLQAELPGLAMLLDWEKAVYEAADRSVFGIMSLSSTYGREAGAAVVATVKAIADAAAGHGAQTEPFRAFSSGMGPVLIDRLEHAAPDNRTESKWAKALRKIPKADLNGRQISALNSFLHYAPVNQLSKGPGVVYELGIPDVIGYLRPEYRSARKALLSGEFVPLKDLIKQGRTPKDISDGLIFAKSCKWRFVQMGAACDYVNKKSRVVAGHLAVQLPETSFGYTHLIKGGTQFSDNPHNSDWLFQTPPFDESGRRCALIVNLRFPLIFSRSAASALVPVYRCREALASEIATSSAQYSIRPGIVEFRKQLRG